MRLIFTILLVSFRTTLFGLDLTFTQAVVQSQNSTIIPFNNYENLIILKARVSGQEGNFIMDTGASGLVLNSAHFEASEMLETSAYGMGGDISDIGRSNPDTTQIESIMFFDISAEHIDLTEIEERKKIKILGLIGYDLIKNYEIMINYREKYVTFSNLDDEGEIIEKLPHTTNKIDSFAFELARFIPVIAITIDGKAKRMGIDTGAEMNIIDNRRNRDILENFKVVNRINISSADGRRKQALAGILFRLKLGEKYRCASMATMMTNINNLNEIYGTRLDGILGQPFLAPWIFSFNYKKKQMYMHEIKFAKT